jgi:hypothetical protein
MEEEGGLGGQIEFILDVFTLQERYKLENFAFVRSKAHKIALAMGKLQSHDVRALGLWIVPDRDELTLHLSISSPVFLFQEYI